jgi:anaerobic magnesium-protoporphyrin IX monomethyl ester cyclase
MKVIFINPPVSPHRKIMRDFDCAGESKGNYLYQPYDLLLMSGFVPRDWEFSFFDAVANPLSLSDLDFFIKENNPDVVVCAVAGINWSEDFETLKHLRGLLQGKKLFTFGDLFLDEVSRQQVRPFVDGIFTSPVDFSFSSLEDKDFNSSRYFGFYEGLGTPIKNLKAPRQIRIPMPRHEAFIHPSYRWPFSRSLFYTTITTSWGCPYSCSYCILNKFPNLWRPWQDVIEEMQKVKKLGFRELYIGDKSFGLPQINVFSLLDAMIKENFGFSWSTYFHPNQFSERLLLKMKLAGCHTIIIGIETKNFDDLKKFGRFVRKDQFFKLLNFAKSIGMEVCGDFILGLPQDTEESVNELISFACDLDIDYASFNIATPLPGSTLREMAIEKKLITPGSQHFDSSGHNEVLSLSDLTPLDLKRLREKAVRHFYARPDYLLKRITRIRDIEHLKIQLQEGVELLRRSLGFI